MLLDTHVLLWWLLDASAISRAAHAAISDETNEIFVSAASAWEIAIKYKTGKLPDAAQLMASLEVAIAHEGFDGMPITLRHGAIAGSLPSLHKDPFDRMLIAQASGEAMTLISNERVFDRYGVARLW